MDDFSKIATFEAVADPSIAKGIVVMLVDAVIVYAGPIKKSPPPQGGTVLMHPEDFALFKAHQAKRGKPH